MVVLVVTWMAVKDRDDEVASIFSKLSAEARKEPGCVMFAAQRHKTNRARFLIYEQYRDDAALEAHRASAHYKEYVLKRLPPLAVRVEGELYDPLP
jgi:quinol monooxygenase YgiN